MASTWWEAAKSWQPWFVIHPESARGAPGQEVTAVWNGQHLDLFMSDDHGHIVSTWWEAGKGWQPWFAIHPDTGTAAPGQPVTALWTNNGTHLDLFITDQYGRVLSSCWEAAKGWQPWFDIHSDSRFAPARQRVTARWSSSTHLDLFVSSLQGQVLSTWWEAAKGWQPWFQIQATSLQVKNPQTVTAIWNGSGHLDLFATAADGSVASTWWEASRNWQPWFRMFPDVIQARIGDRRNVITQGHDAHRTGGFPSERILTPQAVASGRFGRLYSRKVDGQMFAQPLYIRQVATQGHGNRNLLVLATTANKVYAFDADNATPQDSNALIFQTQLHPSSAVEQAAHNTEAEVCDQTFPRFFGITATPVIDPATESVASINGVCPAQAGAVPWGGVRVDMMLPSLPHRAHPRRGAGAARASRAPQRPPRQDPPR